MLRLSFLLLGVCTFARRSPIVFVVTDLVGNATGTSIRMDGEWIRGEMDRATSDKLLVIWPEATVLVVNTDDEIACFPRIDAWMMRECENVQRRSDGDCFVVSGSHNQYHYRTSGDVYDFKRWESSLRIIVKHSFEPITPLGSLRPTFALTSSPTLARLCESRSEVDCAFTPDCSFFGVSHGCRSLNWCGFVTKLACDNHEGCEYVRNRCRTVTSQYVEQRVKYGV